MEAMLLVILLAPFVASALILLAGQYMNRRVAHSIAIAAVFVSMCLSFYVLYLSIWGGLGRYEQVVYTWGFGGPFQFNIGFLIDRLSALMLCVVTFVSFAVHIFTIGYMADDPGYKRFFGYIALFTFSMLLLVMANNFMQLFMGWEMVGLVSYLLIGFWFTRESAIFANLKAFIVNRVGDFGFLLGIAAVLYFAGSLNYGQVFAQAPLLTQKHIWLTGHYAVAAPTIICILLFIGAMGKSAQIPLHGWLPDSMEGPTPISALIHAATMVTAGIFMVARMSPLFSLSVPAMTLVMFIGATGAFFLGLVGIVQDDIKRVIAYSTLSQLGYMAAALGAGAYAGGIFHLATHACFKALLFLGAGSVIIAMHHEQDMRKMGGLARYMPVTYVTFIIGSLALCGFPGFAGYFSKDAIIDAIRVSTTPGAAYAYWCALLGVLVTTVYTFRMIFLTFHGKPRMDAHTREHLKESPWVVTVPLVLLAIPSLFLGGVAIGHLDYGHFFGASIVNRVGNNPLLLGADEFHGVWSFFLKGFASPAFFLVLAGIAITWGCYIWRPELPAKIRKWFYPVAYVLERKYFVDDIYFQVFSMGARRLGNLLWRVSDDGLIDGVMVNGSARCVRIGSNLLRRLQSGYLYHYAFAMVIGIAIMVGWLVWG